MQNNYENYYDALANYCMGIQFSKINLKKNLFNLQLFLIFLDLEQYPHVSKLNDYIKSSDNERR